MKNSVITKSVGIVLISLLVAGCVTPRKNLPPEGEIYSVPWGAVGVEATDDRKSNIIPESTRRIVTEQLKAFSDEHPGEKLPYRMLALSGGGSRGAYGAGILSGWTEYGNRPQFDVVTGISTGALMATAAFLGPEYDELLRAFTEVSNDDIFTSNGITAWVSKESLYDTTPLRNMLARLIDESVLEAVADEYQSGRNLFIGTTNLDANVFTIWDMGKIANSDKPDRLRLYRDILLASAAFPVGFPPVYIDIETSEGEHYQQMHIDGGARETVFIYDFLGEWEEVLVDMGFTVDEHIDFQVYLLYNGTVFDDGKYGAVNSSIASISLASIDSLMRKNLVTSIYSIWAFTLASGGTMHLSFIPSDYQPMPGVLEFDQEIMGQLYEFGYQQSLNDTGWLVQTPPETLDEYEELLDIYSVLDPLVPQTENEKIFRELHQPKARD